MKIVYLITGSGGSFYCGNCYRDMIYLRAIRKVDGISASAIPLYLPPELKNPEDNLDKNVFFGAISMYLREKVPVLRKMPAFIDKLLDNRPMLRMAARQSGSTRTEGLEVMTLDMIRGENAFPEKELDRLVEYLVKDGKPDIIHLSNSLIIGLAHHLKEKLGVRIVCSLLNEDDWIEEMAEPYRSEAWELIARRASDVDSFISSSTYFKELIKSKTGLNGNNINVIPLAFDQREALQTEKTERNPAIGFFSRMNFHNGFDKIVDAFILLKESDAIPLLSLHVSGGYTGDDKSFVKKQIKKITDHKLTDSFKIYSEFDGESKKEFFSNIDVMSVPVRKYDGYGLYLLEANAAGIPVVQPATGAFPEIVEMTSGGLIYKPDTVEELAESLSRILKDKDLQIRLGQQGKEKVKSEFSLEKMAESLSEIYNSLI